MILQRTSVAVPPLSGYYRIVICCAGAGDATRYHPHTFDPNILIVINLKQFYTLM
jgi:hypothetical protein